MDSRKLSEKKSASEETKTTDDGLRTDTVKLVEIGDASAETKGIARGIEWGFTPRY